MTNGYGYSPTLDAWLGVMGWERPAAEDIGATVEQLATETRRLADVEDRAQRMYRHGTPLTRLCAATVLGVGPELTGPSGTVRVDGTRRPEPPTPELVAARDTTRAIAADVIEQVEHRREIDRMREVVRAYLDAPGSRARLADLVALVDGGPLDEQTADRLMVRRTDDPTPPGPSMLVDGAANGAWEPEPDDPDDDMPNPGGDPDDYDRERGRVPR